MCRPGEALCAPCGAPLTAHSVALTFSYDFFDVVVLPTEFEVCHPIFLPNIMLVTACGWDSDLSSYCMGQMCVGKAVALCKHTQERIFGNNWALNRVLKARE